MLYKINEEKKCLERCVDTQEVLLEKYLEKCLMNVKEGDIIDQNDVNNYFFEELLFIKNQPKTRNKKIADIIALDKSGNGVIIELKRVAGKLGVETQSLQYLVDFTKDKGEDFIKRFTDNKDELKKKIESFIGTEIDISNLNKKTRIILVARHFDEVLFSMGEWLSQKGVSMKCISYTLTDIDKEKYISFSVAFDRSDYSLYDLNSAPRFRNPKIFWHNIAKSNQEWWEFLVENAQIPACFDNEIDDKGYKLLNNYIVGDKIIAYAGGFGAIGWGEIEKLEYKLVKKDSEFDKLSGVCLHRLKITWKAIAKHFKDCISSTIVNSEYGIHHPLRTSVSIDPKKAERLIEAMNEKFNK